MNAPSADYNSAALTLSYTGFGDFLPSYHFTVRSYHFARAPRPSVITLEISVLVFDMSDSFAVFSPMSTVRKFHSMA